MSDITEFLYEIGDGKIGKELLCILGARYKILYITTEEERRVIDCFRLIGSKDGYKLYSWDIANGMLDLERGVKVEATTDIHSNPHEALNWIIELSRQDAKKTKERLPKDAKGHIFLMHDLYQFLNGDGDPILVRILKTFSQIPSTSTIVIVSHSFICPPGLSSSVTMIDFPYPSKGEILRVLNAFVKDLITKYPDTCKFAETHSEELINSVSGLTISEAENAFAKTIVKLKQFDIPTILEEKKQIILKKGVLEYKTPKLTFDDIGGLDVLKKWLSARKISFTQEASDFGIEYVKGLIIFGTPGCGKSLTSEAVASYYNLPLLRFDLSQVFSSLVGSSEKNVRESLKIAESVSPCLLQIEEADKAFSGIKSSGVTDGGLTSRILGTILTWMQEKTKPVFVIATANNVHEIPPEFLRAGRFDEIFFVDLPNEQQRCEVIKCLLKRKNRDCSKFDVLEISRSSDNYSPAEIEKAINSALFYAFSDNRRELTTMDIVRELGSFQPLYNSKREDINAMREWSKGRAVLAASNEQKTDIISEMSRNLAI